jgi:hydroxymethylbilane synthase
MTKQTLKIGTRGSRLALIQTDMVMAALMAAHPGLTVEKVIIKTSGDWKPADGETRLAEEQGGKGLFAREIEKAMLDGAVDCGVHSLKDMSSFLPEGLVINHVLPREDVRDALISARYKTIDDLPPGAVIGTSSLRRQAFMLAHRPDLNIVPLRGNVETRLQKLKDGQVDATLLAMAGLNRMGLADEATCILEPEDMLPACGQGAVCIETRDGDEDTQRLFDALHCHETGLCVFAEREVLAVLDGSCHTPIGAYAVLEKGVLYLRALVASEDGQALYYESARGEVEGPLGAKAFGHDLGRKLKAALPPGFLA